MIKKAASLAGLMILFFGFTACGTLQMRSATEGPEAGTFLVTANPPEYKNASGKTESANISGKVLKCTAPSELEWECNALTVNPN